MNSRYIYIETYDIQLCCTINVDVLKFDLTAH